MSSCIKLDDGWPESVEEQGLLLLVWRRNIRNDIWKLCYRQSRRGVSRQDSEKCKTIVCIANTFTHRRLHTDAFTHKAFTHRSFYTNTFTQTLLHTEAFTYKHFYTQMLLHTNALTHRRFYTRTLFTHRRFLRTDAFTHKHIYTQRLLHTNTFTQTLLHTNTFTHRRFYTQTLWHTDAFTHRRFYTPRLLHTDTFYTQALLHTDKNGTSKIAILPQFLPIDPHFVRKGCSGTTKIATSFRAKGLLRHK